MSREVARAAEHNLVPEPDAVIDLFVDVVARKKLFFIKPATDP